MSTLEVLQKFPSHKKVFLSVIVGMDPSDSNLVFFSHENYTPYLLAQLVFIIQVIIHGKNIHRSIVDEGASTCIMSMSY